MAGHARKPSRSRRRPGRRAGVTKRLRIIGGRYGGRWLSYQADLRTRPMKERTREAVFDRLGPAVADMHAIDLFAGTGALGFEALSRGAARVTFVERNLAAAKSIQQNVAALNVQDRAEVITVDAFRWAGDRGASTDQPWLVFCCPPYDFYVARRAEMVRLLCTLVGASPPRSIFVVEADRRFDFAELPQHDGWDLRCYRPARIGILRKRERS